MRLGRRGGTHWQGFFAPVPANLDNVLKIPSLERLVVRLNESLFLPAGEDCLDDNLEFRPSVVGF